MKSQVMNDIHEVLHDSRELGVETLKYFLRLRLEALPGRPRFHLTPERVIELIQSASAAGGLTRVRLWRVMVRLSASALYQDTAAFESALRDLLELGKVGAR